MAKYTLKKILGMIPMLLIITFIIYWLLDLTPGDPTSYLMDPEALARLSAEQYAALRAQYGLDDPFVIRYFKWLVRLLHGDFGYSAASGVPVILIMVQSL
ncbi:MAG: ABC transporter permease, partial [Acetivibrio ethanolgignens]